ncbi:MAG: hypothetical protein ACRYG6_06990 [Janthinobacterium lividum]
MRLGVRSSPPPARLRRKLAMMGAVAGVALCVEGWFAWTHRTPRRPPELGSDMAMVLAVRDRILAAGLAHAPQECLAFFIHEPPPGEPTPLDVFQKHNDACPGDPGAAPRLFGVRVDRASGRMWDDAAQAGVFAPLPG